MIELTEENIDAVLDKIYLSHRKKVKELAKYRKFAKIDLSADMFDGKLATKINITVKESEII